MKHHSAHVRNVAERRKERTRRRPTISDLRKKMRDTMMEETTDTIDDLFVGEENEEEYQSFKSVSTEDTNFFPSSSPSTPQNIIRCPSKSSENSAPSICVSSVIGSKTGSTRGQGYKPKTLAQYRKYKKSLNSEPLGKLPPDLNRPELIRKRAKKERIRAFSERLRQVNTSAIRSRKNKSRPAKSEEEKEEIKQPSARERALEFARTIPKPKLRQREEVASFSTSKYQENDVTIERAPVQSRLDILRARHRDLQSKVDLARKSVGL
jgi:hypothetical protein